MKRPARRKQTYLLPARRLVELQALLAARKPDPQAEFNVDHDLCQSVWPEETRRGFKSLSLPRRRYLACFYLEMEVNNGGFVQFFDNQGPAVAREALNFLDRFRINPVASLLRRAIAAFPGGRLPRTREKTLDITIADMRDGDKPGPLNRKLERITERFFDGNFAPKLIRARLECARAHAKHFFAGVK